MGDCQGLVIIILTTNILNCSAIEKSPIFCTVGQILFSLAGQQLSLEQPSEQSHLGSPWVVEYSCIPEQSLVPLHKLYSKSGGG